MRTKKTQLFPSQRQNECVTILCVTYCVQKETLDSLWGGHLRQRHVFSSSSESSHREQILLAQFLHGPSSGKQVAHKTPWQLSHEAWRCFSHTKTLHTEPEHGSPKAKHPPTKQFAISTRKNLQQRSQISKRVLCA